MVMTLGLRKSSTYPLVWMTQTPAGTGAQESGSAVGSGQLDLALGIKETEVRRDGRDREEKGRGRRTARLWQLLFGALLSFSIS
jgi:hypothetical protein